MSVLRTIGRLDFTSRSVFVRCVVLLALSTGLVAVTLGVMSQVSAHGTARQSVRNEAVQITRLVAGQVGGGIMFDKGETIEPVLDSVIEGAEGVALGGLALNAGGDEVAFAGSGAAHDALRSQAVEAAASGEIARSADGFTVAAPVRFGKDNAIVGAVATAWTPEPGLAEIRRHQTRAALVTIGLFLAALLATGWVTRRTITRPLMAVDGAMGRVASGDLGIEVPEADRRDEIGSIAKTLVEFRDSLRAAEEVGREAAFKGAACEGSSSPMMMADTDFNITFLNSAMRMFFDEHADEFRKIVPDFDPENIIGRNMDDFHRKPAHQRGMVSDLSKLPLKVEVQLGESYLTISVSPVRDAQGNDLGIVSEWHDVTRIRRNFAILSALNANQVWIDMDGRGKIVGVNDCFCTSLGVAKEEATGRMASDVLTPDGDVEAELSRIEEAMAAGRSHFARFHVALGDARRAVIEGSLTPVLDTQGRVSRRVLIASDVTEAQAALQAADAERKAAAEAQARVVEALGTALEQLSDGDMTAAIEMQFAPEYERLREDFNRAMSKLLSAMRAVVENSGAIAGEVHGITHASNELSSRTENQAATLEQTAAALDELTASVKSSAERAAQAAQVVQEARSSAEDSGTVVREAVTAMGEIEQSSQKISKIIGVIDDIAFQTNLLALNAGVEAARAGDAGRGFAVVASEVRALAQRSSDAAREINGLISSSGAQVKRGVGLVGDTGRALERIVSSVAGIAAHVGEIAISSSEQSQGLAEINQAMIQLDQVTQQNAAMFEETSAASQALAQASDVLSDTVGRFRTDAGHTTPIPFRPAAIRATAGPVPKSGPARGTTGSAPLRRKTVNTFPEPVAADDHGWAEF